MSPTLLQAHYIFFIIHYAAKAKNKKNLQAIALDKTDSANLSLKYSRQSEARTANKRYNKCGLAYSLKHLNSLYTFPDNSGQVVLADSEQQFIPALAMLSAVVLNYRK